MDRFLNGTRIWQDPRQARFSRARQAAAYLFLGAIVLADLGLMVMIAVDWGN